MNDNHKIQSLYPRFRLRTLLLITTATCVLLVISLAIVPDSLPLWVKLFVFLSFAAVVAYAARIIYQSKHQPWTLPEDTVTVQVDTKWLRRVKSPYILGPVSALTGVSVTFAPMYLLMCGQVEEFGLIEWVLVPTCFIVIYLVPGFYMRLASEVITQLLKLEKSSSTP